MSAPTTTAAPAGFVREIDSRHANARDWDHEGDLDSLQAECLADQQDTGCAGHDYFSHERDRYWAWRVWEGATARRTAFTRPVPLMVTPDIEGRMLAASYALHLRLADIARIGIAMALTEYESTGRLQVLPMVPSSPVPPPLLLSDKTRARMAELDSGLQVDPGHGIAETTLADLLQDILDDDLSFLDGWEWDDRRQTETALWAMAGRWSAEDAAMEGRAAA